MFLRTYSIILLILFCTVLFVPEQTSALDETFYTGTIMTTATFRWDNENWFTEAHPKVAEFTVRTDGSAYGMTETGVSFTQENVENELNLRIQKFVMQDHYHYVIDGEVVYSLEDFSIQLARAYNERTGA